MCGTTETCPTPEVGQTPPAFSLTLGLPRVYHLSGPGLDVKVRAPTTEERPCPPPPLLSAVLRLGRGMAAGERPRQSLLLRHPVPRLPPRLVPGDALRHRPRRARRGPSPLHQPRRR